MLTVYHSNRLEALAAHLGQQLQQTGADHVLRPRTVVVPHPSMGRWLQLHLADRDGIAANLHFPLPARFIWHVFRHLFPNLPPRSRFDRPVLIWHLMKLLEAEDVTADDLYVPLRQYLDSDPDADRHLKRYQLAQQLADAYDRYLTYRRDWIHAWDAGEEVRIDAADTAWQRALWRSLAGNADGDPHWVALLARLDRSEVLARVAEQFPEPVHVFGLTSVSPAYLDVFRRLAGVVDVNLYFPNPSLHWWGEIVPERFQLRLRQRLGAGHALAAEGAAHLESGHPLLASLGQAGKDFLRALYDGADTQDEEAFVDPAPEGAPTLLQRLQRDILFLDSPEPAPATTGDGSIQVHDCHSPMREVEVLHDQLLALLDADPTLTPRDIVVMIPNVGVYAPYIQAVFNRHQSADPRHLPYTLSDRAAREDHPILDAFCDLLDLPNSRWTASDILDLLRVPAIGRRCALSAAELETLQDWVAQSGIRWGLDEAYRERLGAGRFRQNSWAFGLDRLLLGYAVSDDHTVIDNVLPFPHVEGSEAEALGKLAGFLDHLQRFERQLRDTRTTADWCALLQDLLTDLFQPLEADEQEQAALGTLRDAVQSLHECSGQADYDGQLSWAVIREYLEGCLEQTGPSQPFLDRGVTFCALVPMRNLPFRVVCLLGMNGNDFPRQEARAGFDLMAAAPRPGDRSRRADDRYLFLEALLAARECLYISYTGRSIRDNGPREPSVVVSELLDLLERDYGADRQALVCAHRMHPFSPHYFGAEHTRLFSYAAEWQSSQPAANDARLGPFLDAPLTAAEDEWREVDLRQLAGFFRDPARYLLNRRLRLRLPEAEELADEEPQALDHLTRYQLCEELIMEALNGEGTVPESPSDRLRASGRLPPGPLGGIAYQEHVHERARALHEGLLARVAPERRREPLEVPNLDFTLSDGTGLRLSGWLHRVYDEGLVHWRPGELRARDQLLLWLEHLALHACTTTPDGWRSQLLGLKKGALDCLVLTPLDPAAARACLQDLLALYWEALHGQRDALLLYPDDALTYAEAWRADQDHAAALTAVENNLKRRQGTGWTNEYVTLLTRGLEQPLDDAFCRLARRVFDPLLAAREAG